MYLKKSVDLSILEYFIGIREIIIHVIVLSSAIPYFNARK